MEISEYILQFNKNRCNAFVLLKFRYSEKTTNIAHLPLFLKSNYKWKIGQIFCGLLRIFELKKKHGQLCCAVSATRACQSAANTDEKKWKKRKKEKKTRIINSYDIPSWHLSPNSEGHRPQWTIILKPNYFKKQSS